MSCLFSTVVILRKIIGYIGIGVILCAILASFNAYLVFSISPSTGATYDGFGRYLTESPWFMRQIFGEEKLWAGWYWFVVDNLILWVNVGIGWVLIEFGFGEQN
jgi:hypothetical protein